MTIVEELRAKVSRDNRELLDRAADEIEDLDRNLAAAYKRIEELERQQGFEAGQSIWVVERDHDEAVDVSQVLFLAKSKGCIIAAPYIDDLNFDETIEYLIEQTSENVEAELLVYHIEDCFATKEEAKRELARIKLKPCPFCGGEAVMYHQSGKYADYDADYVYCMRCGCRTKIFDCGKGTGKTHADTEKEAMASWNRRADNEQREAD